MLKAHIEKKESYRQSGIDVNLENGQEAFLPYKELSFDEKVDIKNQDLIESRFPIRKEFYVKIFDKEFGGKQRPIVSVRLLEYDPWEMEVPKWKIDEDIKIMYVRYIQSMGYIYGEISIGIEARVHTQNIKEALKDKKNPFFNIKVGDRISGVIKEINLHSRMVELDVKKLMERIERDPTLSLDLLSIKKKRDEPNNDSVYFKLEESMEDDDIDIESVSSLNTAFILDDKDNVLDALVEHLEAEKINVIKANTLEEAEQKLFPFFDKENIDIQNKLPHIDMAMIDIQLTENINQPKYEGITFAKKIQEILPECKIVLLTAETMGGEINPRKKEQLEDLDIVTIATKPLFGLSLRKVLQETMTKKPRSALDFFEFGEEDKTKEKVKVKDRKDKINKIKEILSNLYDNVRADTIVLFSIHSNILEVNQVECIGKSFERFTDFHNKLRFSPVRDVAIEKKSWYHDNVKDYWFNKHRYLSYAYSSDGYESCAGVPVEGLESDQIKYALFAFGKRKDQFDKIIIEQLMEIAALKIGKEFMRKRMIEAEEERHPFYMTGLSCSSIGHDLLNHLEVFSGIIKLKEKLEEYKKGKDINIDSLIKRSQIIEKSFQLVAKIAQNMALLGKGYLEKEDDYNLDDIIIQSWKNSEKETEKCGILLDKPKTLSSRIRCRATIMQRTVQNLFNNAAQQTSLYKLRHGIIRVEEEMERKGEKEIVRIDIVDNGPGVHWVDRKNIFKHGFSTREKGSGMGLHICKQELEKMNATISLDASILFVGSRFSIRYEKPSE